LVAPVKHRFLNEVQDSHRTECNREEDGNAKTKHESDEHSVEDGRVLVVDVIAGSRVEILILLNRRAFTIIFAARADSTVENAETNTHAPVHQKFNEGVVHVENHGGNQLIANSFEEGTVEVAVLAPFEHQSDRLL
jgi:hypothetical protein